MKKNALAAVYVLLPATKMQLLWKTEKHIFCVMIFCDGFGDCLPACPAGAITIEERESAEYNPVEATDGSSTPSGTTRTTT